MRRPDQGVPGIMRGRTVLLIDYEPRSLEETRKPLEASGFHVETAHDGVRGIEAFQRVHPDLVLVEAMLPKKHGFDVCQAIKSMPEGRSTPVVIMTAIYRGRKYRDQAFRNFHCDDYLEKPVTDDRLLETCRKVLNLGVDAGVTAAQGDSGSPGASPFPPALAIGATAVVPPAVAEVPAPVLTGEIGLDLGEGAAHTTTELPGEIAEMTEAEISDRLDALLSDFGEAIAQAAPEPAAPVRVSAQAAAVPEVVPVQAPRVEPAPEPRITAPAVDSQPRRVPPLAVGAVAAMALAAVGASVWWFALRDRSAPLDANAARTTGQEQVVPVESGPGSEPISLAPPPAVLAVPPAEPIAVVSSTPPLPTPAPADSELRTTPAVPAEPEVVDRSPALPTTTQDVEAAEPGVPEIPTSAPTLEVARSSEVGESLRLPPAVVESGPEPIALAPRTAAGDLVPIGQVDTSPVLRERVAPVYHPLARERGEQGTVEVGFLIDESGRVSEVAVVQGSGFRTLDDSAIAAVRRWKYAPATKDGVPVKVRTSARLSFQK